MMLNVVSDEPCPRCGRHSEYGNIAVIRNSLFRGCCACGLSESVTLPPLQKRIIYLDQNFLSHAFRRQAERFCEAAERIGSLVAKQVIVCPWSEVHQIETHLWRDYRANELWAFVKRTARGHRFLLPIEILIRQIERLFTAYRQGNRADGSTFCGDAISSRIHEWDDYHWIDVGRPLEDFEAVRTRKKHNAKMLQEAMIGWSSQESNFEADMLEEATIFAQDLEDRYRQWLLALATGSHDEAMEMSDLAQVLNVLLLDAGDEPTRMQEVRQFLRSSHFRTAPAVDIASRLFAVLRKLARRGHRPKRLSGVLYDIDAIRSFAPYCDAVFVDREMGRWMNDSDAKVGELYGVRIFSVDTWNDFDSYLDDLEKEAKKLGRHLRRVYGPLTTHT